MPRSRLLPALLVGCLAPLMAGCGAGSYIEEVLAGVGDEFVVPLPPGGSPTAMSDGERIYALEVLRLVNEERSKVALPALAWDEPAAAVAYAHSADMDARQFFSHVNPSGQDPGARLAAAGVTGFATFGENIALGQRTPAIVVSEWMASEGHRENILNPAFTHLGVGVHSTSNLWWTQDFLDRDFE